MYARCYELRDNNMRVDDFGLNPEDTCSVVSIYGFGNSNPTSLRDRDYYIPLLL